MRTTRLLGLLVAALLGAALLSAPGASATDPRNDHTRLPRACATPQEKIPQHALICYLTPFQTNRPTVFLWGDSHAWMQIPGLMKAAKGEQVNLVASMMGSCPPMDPGLAPKDRYLLGECAASADMAMRYVRKMANGSQDFKLILAANWEMYERALKLIAKGTAPRGGHGGYAFKQAGIFKQGGPRMVKQLAELRVDVDIVDQFARPPRKPKPCKRMDPYACDFPRRQAFRDEAGNRQWLGRIMAPVVRQGAAEIDVNDVLCSRRTCHAKVNGVWTYHDNSHITASMSRLLAPFYAPSVADVVPGMLAPAPVDGGGGEEPCSIAVLCR